jgi:hypothetical protein
MAKDAFPLPTTFKAWLSVIAESWASRTAFCVGPPLIIATAVVAVLTTMRGWSPMPATVLCAIAGAWCVLVLPAVMFFVWRDERCSRNQA